jgi:hypothetical protein
VKEGKLAKRKPKKPSTKLAPGLKADHLGEGARVELYGGRDKGIILRESDPETGRVVHHVRKMDFLDNWLEAGRITRDQYYAAQDFRVNFRIMGGGERYKTIFDITNTSSRGGHSDPLSGAADARRYVEACLNPLGAKAKEALWHIVGLEWSLNQYVEQKRLAGYSMTRDTAAGLVEAALEVIAMVHGKGHRKPAARTA